MKEFLKIMLLSGIVLISLISLSIWLILYYPRTTEKYRKKLDIVRLSIDISERANVETLCEDDIDCYNRERAIRSGIVVKKHRVHSGRGYRTTNIYSLNGVEVYRE